MADFANGEEAEIGSAKGEMQTTSSEADFNLPKIMITPPTPREANSSQPSNKTYDQSCLAPKRNSHKPHFHPSFFPDYGQPVGDEQITLMLSATEVFAKLKPLEQVEAAAKAPWQKAMNDIHKRRSRGRLHGTKPKIDPVEGLHHIVTTAFGQPIDSYEADLMRNASEIAPAYDAAYKVADPARQNFKRIRADLKASMAHLGNLLPQDEEGLLLRRMDGLQIGEGPSLTKQAKQERDMALETLSRQKQQRVKKADFWRSRSGVGEVVKRSGKGEIGRKERRRTSRPKR